MTRVEFFNKCSFISNLIIAFYSLYTFFYLFPTSLPISIIQLIVASIGAVATFIGATAVYRIKNANPVTTAPAHATAFAKNDIEHTLWARLIPAKRKYPPFDWDYIHITKTICFTWPATFSKGCTAGLALYLIHPVIWIIPFALFVGFCNSHMQYGKLQPQVQSLEKEHIKIFFSLRNVKWWLPLLFHNIAQATIAWYMVSKLILILSGCSNIVALMLSLPALLTGMSTTDLYARPLLNDNVYTTQSNSKGYFWALLFTIVKATLAFGCSIRIMNELQLITAPSLSAIIAASPWYLPWVIIISISFIFTQFSHASHRCSTLALTKIVHTYTCCPAQRPALSQTISHSAHQNSTPPPLEVDNFQKIG